MLKILLLSLCLSCAVSTESFAGFQETAAAVAVGVGSVGAAAAHFGFGASVLTSVFVGGATGIGVAGAGAAGFMWLIAKLFIKFDDVHSRLSHKTQ